MRYTVDCRVPGPYQGCVAMRNRVSALIGLPLVALAHASGPALAQGTPAAPAATAVGGVGTPARSSAVFTLTARYDSNVPRLNDDSVNPSCASQPEMQTKIILRNIARLTQDGFGLALTRRFHANNGTDCTAVGFRAFQAKLNPVTGGGRQIIA